MKLDDSYVVRIFRREPGTGNGQRTYDRVALTGVVERPDSGTRTVFHSAEELWAVLARRGKGAPKTRRGKRNLPVTRLR